MRQHQSQHGQMPHRRGVLGPSGPTMALRRVDARLASVRSDALSCGASSGAALAAGSGGGAWRPVLCRRTSSQPRSLHRYGHCKPDFQGLLGLFLDLN